MKIKTAIKTALNPTKQNQVLTPSETLKQIAKLYADSADPETRNASIAINNLALDLYAVSTTKVTILDRRMKCTEKYEKTWAGYQNVSPTLI